MTSLIARLNDISGQIDEVRKICQVPSISYGVIHDGEVVLTKSVGFRDEHQKLEANPDSIYMIGSCSKMFASAAAGILVDEGKLHWLDPISKHLSDFNPAGDANIGKKADIIDGFRHSTGLACPQLLCLGPHGTIINDETDYIRLLNAMPTANHEGQRFNSWWMYNNYPYGLMAKVIEKASGSRYAHFLKERMLSPLGMSRTAVFKSDIRDDDNIAYPHFPLSDGTFAQVSADAWPCDDHSPMLAAMGMRSSLNDMLAWSKAVLAAEWNENQTGDCKVRESPSPNPLKQMNKIRTGYWTRPVDDQFQNEAEYCLGWLRVTTPSSMLGLLSFDGMMRKEKAHLDNILGTKSKQHLAIGHNGLMPGSSAFVYTFPETQSGVVVLSNGLGLADASEFTAQLLIQALFDLRPHINLMPLIKMESDLRRDWYQTKVLGPWLANRKPNDQERHRQLYIGDYKGVDDTATLSILPKGGNTGSDPALTVVFNHHAKTICDLGFYKQDTYSFMSTSYDNWKTSSTLGWNDYRRTLLVFHLDESETEVVGLEWTWDEDEKPAWMKKISDSRTQDRFSEMHNLS